MDKTCTRCRRTLPATSEYFHQRGRSTARLDSWCRSCRQASNLALPSYALPTPEQASEVLEMDRPIAWQEDAAAIEQVDTRC